MLRLSKVCICLKRCSVSAFTNRAAPSGAEWRRYVVGVCRAAPSGAEWRRYVVGVCRAAPSGAEWRRYVVGVCRAAPSGAEWRRYVVGVCRAAPSGAPRRHCAMSAYIAPPGAQLRLCTVGACHFRVLHPHVPAVSISLFHTSHPCRALPAPLLWLVFKPVQKLMAIVLGRSVRVWWRSLPPNRQQVLRQAAWGCRWHLAAGLTGLLTLLAAFCLTHLDEAPVTGRTRLLVFSHERFMELATIMSREYMEEFKESTISLEDPRHKVVDTVVKHLVQRNQDIAEMSAVPWSVHVVDGPSTNAFVLPDGNLFIFTGMLEVVTDVHQLTVVLGHEMAHAIMAHSAEQASLSHLVDFLTLVLLTAIWAICPQDSLALLGQWIQGRLVQFLFDRPYSRKLEMEADEVGLQLAAKACADVRAGPVFWHQMELTDQLNGMACLPDWLSTHPSHRNRVNQIERLVPQALDLRASCDCPALPHLDPRLVFLERVRHLVDSEKAEATEGKRNAITTTHPTCLPPQMPETPQMLQQTNP